MERVANPNGMGLQRKKKIVSMLEDYRALNTEQITAKFFSEIKYGQRKAQSIMLALYKSGKVSRCMGESGYIYYLDKKPGMLKHLISLNWVRLYIEATCSPDEQMYMFEYEKDFGILRTDALVSIFNNSTGCYRVYFIEMDRGTNKFDKAVRFSRFFKKGWHEDQWWFKETGCLPTVLVFTTTEMRERVVNEMIDQWNTANLQYNVELLSTIISKLLD